MKITITLCLFAIVFSVQSDSSVYPSVDPGVTKTLIKELPQTDSPAYLHLLVDSLPENAEEIALEFLENFMSQRYPGEDITIGEPMRLYLPDNEKNALDFPIAIHHEGKLTFDDLEYVHLQKEDAKFTFLDYRRSLSGEQLERANHDEDGTYNSLYELIHNARHLYNNYRSIVIIFSQDKPHILTVHNPAVMFHWDTEQIGLETASEFVGYGVVDGHILTVYLGEDDNLSWFIVDKYELETFNDYEGVLRRIPHRIPPLEWAFFLELQAVN